MRITKAANGELRYLICFNFYSCHYIMRLRLEVIPHHSTMEKVFLDIDKMPGLWLVMIS